MIRSKLKYDQRFHVYLNDLEFIMYLYVLLWTWGTQLCYYYGSDLGHPTVHLPLWTVHDVEENHLADQQPTSPPGLAQRGRHLRRIEEVPSGWPTAKRTRRIRSIRTLRSPNTDEGIIALSTFFISSTEPGVNNRGPGLLCLQNRVASRYSMTSSENYW